MDITADSSRREWHVPQKTDGHKQPACNDGTNTNATMFLNAYYLPITRPDRVSKTVGFITRNGGAER